MGKPSVLANPSDDDRQSSKYDIYSRQPLALVGLPCGAGLRLHTLRDRSAPPRSMGLLRLVPDRNLIHGLDCLHWLVETGDELYPRATRSGIKPGPTRGHVVSLSRHSAYYAGNWTPAIGNKVWGQMGKS